MQSLLVRGGSPLFGEITVQGAKNSILPILAAAFLIPGVTLLHRVPDIRDVAVTVEILETLGCRVRRKGHDLLVDATHPTSNTIPDRLASELRSSVVFLGAILARLGEVHLSYPGGYAAQNGRKSGFAGGPAEPRRDLISLYLNISLTFLKKERFSLKFRSPVASSNSRRSFFCFSVRFFGTSTLITSTWSPRDLLLSTGIPLRGIRSTVPGWVPSGIL
ncbi:MAG: hypothetical protein IKX85_05620 [Clostridia bacterium]|nr:hypothetical protein [Clostridia bacterium]